MSKTVITVQTTVKVSVVKAWEYWTHEKHVVNWNAASDDWHCPTAENDLRVGGKFTYNMAAKDGSFSFDFWGIYDNIIQNLLIEMTLGDDRKVKIEFIDHGDTTEIIESFEAENQNSVDLQRTGWQAILDNYKRYTENN